MSAAHWTRLMKTLDVAKAQVTAQLVDLIDDRVELHMNSLRESLDAVLDGKRTAAPAPRAKAPDPKRRKGPIQLCPVPRCKDRAAPVYGMVCKRHKGVSKKLIAKYRAARRAKKA